MSEILGSPSTLYIIGIATVTTLVALCALSIYYYIKAKDLAPHLHKLAAVRNAIAEAQKTLEELKAEQKVRLDELAKAERIIADGNVAREWLEQNTTKVEALKQEIERLQGKLTEAMDAFQKRQEELDQLTQQISDKEVTSREMERKKEDMEHFFAQEESRKRELAEKIQQLLKDEEAFSKKVFELKSEAAKLEQCNDELTRKIEEQQKRLKEMQEEVSKKKDVIEKLSAQTAKLQGEANAATSILSELSKRRETNEDRWQDLDRPVFENVPAPCDANIDEIRWLKQFGDVLTQNNIAFNERTIKAFHTGLKCADISPLVVLAGISGTGKSLLPSLYASAFGMNFLGVAVQPRWDSPQDMFGFYNYMEGRYKATELSRLLWQFDKYNNDTAKKKYAHLSPLNLVLLDEMNLARVEYYFSDLLSKLEARRGLDFDNPESRKKAEIEIESNASAANKLTRRLFVAPNTLFVGTMNEDESTQTLSDKVIDRANVLRFGRPQELGAKPNIGGFHAAFANTANVTFEDWHRWQKQNSQRIARMKEIFKDVNAVLETVGRPFAHRVWQAMESYVSFYPGNTQQDFHAALADQIEMKILPKLNGLELDAHGFADVKNKLDGIIHTAGDEALKAAFDASCNNQQNTFFKWRGVMR